MSLGDAILVGLAIIGSVPIAVLAAETFAAVWPRQMRAVDLRASRPRCVVLVPAHNEATGIAQTITALRPQLHPGDRVIVIADNCGDATALVARQNGVIAIERNDPDRRGKGFALDFGLKHLADDPPEIVVVIDADTRALPGSLDWLVRAAASRRLPIQGVFTDAPKASGPREQWSSFALTFKNYVRPLGLHRLGLPCLLSGSGMSFPWNVISRASLASGNIVEDMKLGIDLALAGHPARFCPDARFESEDAPNLVAAAARRTRWEHGHVFTILSQSPRLALAGLLRVRPRLLALALELSVPPLSLLFLGQAFLMLVALGWWQTGGSSLPFLILAGGIGMGIATILIAWSTFGRQLISPKFLILLPVYVLWKVPIYLKLLVAPQRKWVRTERKPIS